MDRHTDGRTDRHMRYAISTMDGIITYKYLRICLLENKGDMKVVWTRNTGIGIETIAKNRTNFW